MFFDALERVSCQNGVKKGIGTLSEKTLHAVLKNYFEPFSDNQEIKIGGFVADIVGETGIIEIQTRQFNNLRKKLEQFLMVSDVTVVYPVAKNKWLLWIDNDTGEISKKRKSPKKGIPHEIFFELYKIKYLLNNPRLKFCICMLDIEEYRYKNGWSDDKKRGSTRCERIPVDICEQIYLNCKDDYKRLIPFSKEESFTAKDYAKACCMHTHDAQTALNVLNFMNVVERIGKIGNSYIYKIV